MTRQEFEEKVSQLKPPVPNYGIQEGYVESCLHLAEGWYADKKGDCWEVYYSDRGGKRVLAVFLSEADAFEFLYCELKERSGKHYFSEGGFLDRSEMITKLKKLKILEPETDNTVAFFKDISIGKKEDGWCVVSNEDGGNRMLGIFYYENHANDYVFYLLTKDRVETKKHWWQKLFP